MENKQQKRKNLLYSSFILIMIIGGISVFPIFDILFKNGFIKPGNENTTIFDFLSYLFEIFFFITIIPIIIASKIINKKFQDTNQEVNSNLVKNTLSFFSIIIFASVIVFIGLVLYIALSF
ncbi:MAG: hypothetical protein KBC41_01325 [Candidatus Pacebacteria bacterium]|nr:hypothetical protein [Candidatus Paceibacterota bacterium]MBP9866704.1 hypothetical protein [Candidatus Paceibacterota bacterium]